MTEVKIEPILLSSPKFRRESEDKLAALLSSGWTIAALAGSWVVLARVTVTPRYGQPEDDLNDDVQDDLPAHESIPLDDRRGFSVRE